MRIDNVKEILNRLNKAVLLKNYLILARANGKACFDDGNGLEFVIKDNDEESEWALSLKFKDYSFDFFFDGVTIEKAYWSLEKSLTRFFADHIPDYNPHQLSNLIYGFYKKQDVKMAKLAVNKMMKSYALSDSYDEVTGNKED